MAAATAAEAVAAAEPQVAVEAPTAGLLTRPTSLGTKSRSTTLHRPIGDRTTSSHHDMPLQTGLTVVCTALPGEAWVAGTGSTMTQQAVGLMW